MVSQVELYVLMASASGLTHAVVLWLMKSFSFVRSYRHQGFTNVVLPGGLIETDTLQIEIEPTGNFNSVDEILDLDLIERESGNTVYLRDLVDVERGYENPFNTPVYFNGSAVVIAASMAVVACDAMAPKY